MIPRMVVPTNAVLATIPAGHAEIGDSATASSGGAHRVNLVPRRLIPADAKSVAPLEIGHAPERPQLMVRHHLVPAGASIGDNRALHPAPEAQPAQPFSTSESVLPRRQLFDEALLTKTALAHQRTAAEWLISLAVHAAIVAAVIVLPLFFTQAINPQQLQLTYLVAPPLPAAPAPPLPPAAALSPRSTPKQVAPVTAKLTMPIAIPKAVPKPAENDAATAHPDLVAGIPGGVAGGIPGGQIGGVLGGIAGGTPDGAGLAAPPPAPTQAAPSGPLQVGGAVQSPHLIYAPQPEYPVLAKQARIQGVVEIDAVIDQNGNVVQEHAVSGSGMLIAAALDAVKQWKYQPTYLNGKPYPVELAVNVTFRL